jgi:hypothetical protein
MEHAPWPRYWTPPAMPTMHPGNGLAQHPMVFVGEGYPVIFVVNQGKVIWTYNAGLQPELDDVWMLSNGHILYSDFYYLEEITPKKEVVWHYDFPPGAIGPRTGPLEGLQSHSLQPIGLDKVLFFEHGQPGQIIIMNKANNSIVAQHAVMETLGMRTHTIRMTAQGTILLGLHDLGKVLEYDKNFNVVWTYMTPSPWSVVRLHNGHTLIQDESLRTTIEVDSMGNAMGGTVAWSLKPADLPSIMFGYPPQAAQRLPNGDTVIFDGQVANVNTVQIVEVNPAKQVVWALQDWTTSGLGPATGAQFLDEPGIPENPGDLEY